MTTRRLLAQPEAQFHALLPGLDQIDHHQVISCLAQPLDGLVGPVDQVNVAGQFLGQQGFFEEKRNI